MIIGGKQLTTVEAIDELKERLLHLVQQENWNELELENVSFDRNGQYISRFNDAVWNFISYKVGTEITLLNFEFSEHRIYKSLIQELKVIALAYVYHSRHTYRIGTIRSKIDCLKRLVISLNNAEIHSFEGLTIDDLKTLTKKGFYSPREVDIGPINSLNDLSGFLPFSVNFAERLTLHKLRAKQPLREQHPVIPLRIYLSALNTYTKEIQYWYPYKEQLEQAVQTTFKYERDQANRILKQLRNGVSAVGQVFNKSDKKYFKFLSELKKHNVPLIDYEKSELWDVLWDECSPAVRTDFYEPFSVKTIGNKTFSSHHQVKDFCRELDAKCRYLILCLSGMRSNELLQLTPEFGAQVIILDGINIHLFHTRQQKITPGYQGHNDVYVTTRIGHLAYELVNKINQPVRNWHKEQGHKPWLLNTFTHFRNPRSVHRTGNVLKSITNLFTTLNKEFSVELNSDDIEMLHRSDPEKEFNIGDRWHLTPHQLRRSLAYYLVGMQLADYPQLKQQLSHYSIAMTMYYARNASSFRKMYHDLEKERVRQQALLYSELTNKALQGVRLGGGQGKNMFTESFFSRDMSPAYFEKELKLGRKHIHAIAPGMYCINHRCSMRIGIDLPECTDCDWAIIESAAYAKAARQESISILETLKNRNELSPDIVAFHTVRIGAAEKIMDDMNIDFKQYQLPNNANN